MQLKVGLCFGKRYGKLRDCVIDLVGCKIILGNKDFSWFGSHVTRPIWRVTPLMIELRAHFPNRGLTLDNGSPHQ